MLTDPKVHIATRIIGWQKVLFGIDEGHRRGCQVRRSADELWDVRREHVENLTARNASGHPLGISSKGLEPLVPIGRKLAIEDRLNLGRLGRILLGVVCKQSIPIRTCFASSSAHGLCEVFTNFGWNQEFFVLGPAIILLGQLALFFTKRCSVGAVAIGFVGGPVSDDRVDNDERWSIFGGFEFIESGLQCTSIVGVFDVDRMPT